MGNWPAGTVNITVSGTNTAGTTTTITHPVTVDLAAVAISINTVSGDDVINAAEKSADLTLSGSTSGVEAGQTVTVTFGGKTYTATVAGDGSWTTTVPAADLSALRDGDATVQASVSTINGNTASATHAYSVDATAPTLAINTIATDDILNAAREKGENPLIVVCDELSDPHNLGAVIRTADAAGAHGVIIPKRRSAGLTAVVAKTSAGAVAHVPVARVANLTSLLKELKEEGIWVFGAAAEGSTSLYQADFKGPAAIVIGSEGTGMSRLVEETCDFTVSIPMLGKINSLNASAAAAVLLYEAVRQRRSAEPS